MSPAVTGLENRVSTLGSASATPGRANLRTKIAFVFVRPAPCRPWLRSKSPRFDANRIRFDYDPSATSASILL